MERPSRLPLYVGIALLIAGWAVIFIGWYQSGQQDLETGQLPYVISGGFGGFGLIIMGVIAILADVVRQAESKLRRSAEELHRRMEELAEVFVRQEASSRQAQPASRASAQGGTGARRSRPRRPQQRPPGAASSE
jgi:hypothetical protein